MLTLISWLLYLAMVYGVFEILFALVFTGKYGLLLSSVTSLAICSFVYPLVTWLVGMLAVGGIVVMLLGLAVFSMRLHSTPEE